MVSCWRSEQPGALGGSYGKTSFGKMEPNSELIIGHQAAKRGPSSPKIIVDSNLTVQNSSAIRPTPVKAGKTITHLDNNKVIKNWDFFFTLKLNLQISYRALIHRRSTSHYPEANP